MHLSIGEWLRHHRRPDWLWVQAPQVIRHLAITSISQGHLKPVGDILHQLSNSPNVDIGRSASRSCGALVRDCLHDHEHHCLPPCRQLPLRRLPRLVQEHSLCQQPQVSLDSALTPGHSLQVVQHSLLNPQRLPQREHQELHQVPRVRSL